MRLIPIVFIFAAYAAGCQGGSPVSGSPIQAASAADATAEPAASVGASSIAGDAVKGKVRSGELYCDACHGPNGNSETAEWPSLAGQNASYLFNQMQLLRSGERPSAEMQPIAAPLNDAEIADLAAHYSAQTATTKAAASDATKVGESLYRNGDAARAIPACSSCHGVSGEGNPATGDPAVRAQQPGYTSRQLEAYAKRTRYAPGLQLKQGSANLEIMYDTAEKLSPEEMSSLAAYLHTLR